MPKLLGSNTARRSQRPGGIIRSRNAFLSLGGIAGVLKHSTLKQIAQISSRWVSHPHGLSCRRLNISDYGGGYSTTSYGAQGGAGGGGFMGGSQGGSQGGAGKVSTSYIRWGCSYVLLAFVGHIRQRHSETGNDQADFGCPTTTSGRRVQD